MMKISSSPMNVLDNDKKRRYNYSMEPMHRVDLRQQKRLTKWY